MKIKNSNQKVPLFLATAFLMLVTAAPVNNNGWLDNITGSMQPKVFAESSAYGEIFYNFGFDEEQAGVEANENFSINICLAEGNSTDVTLYFSASLDQWADGIVTQAEFTSSPFSISGDPVVVSPETQLFDDGYEVPFTLTPTFTLIAPSLLGTDPETTEITFDLDFNLENSGSHTDQATVNVLVAQAGSSPESCSDEYFYVDPALFIAPDTDEDDESSPVNSPQTTSAENRLADTGAAKASVVFAGLASLAGGFVLLSDRIRSRAKFVLHRLLNF